eukprot:COSAG06_NODE_119_length_23111_cov_51.658613_15_plen_63_part_00
MPIMHNVSCAAHTEVVRAYHSGEGTGAASVRSNLALQEDAYLFLSFPYVCPEPVLVKRPFLV